MKGAKFGNFLDTNLTFQFVQFGQGVVKTERKMCHKTLCVYDTHGSLTIIWTPILRVDF